MSIPTVTPGSLRWAAILLVAHALLAGAVLLHQLDGGDRPLQTSIALLCVAGAAIGTLGLPWRRWQHPVALGQAVLTLLLLPVVELLTGYGETRPAAATYPLFVMLVLAWVGLTQPRRTALSFTVCVGAVLAGVILARRDGALQWATLAVLLPAGAALGEAAAWMMSELRRLQRHDAQRATTFIDLTRSLDALPQRASRTEVADDLAGAAARLFETRAEVTLIDTEGHDITATAGHTDKRRMGRTERVDRMERAEKAERIERAERAAALAAAGVRLAEPAAGGAGLAGATGTAAAGDGPAGGGGVLTAVRPKRTTMTLVGRRGILGRVQLELDRDPDDAYLTNLVRLFAAQSSAALERFELLTRLDHEVSHDVLTGTGNRRHADKLLSTLRNGDGIMLIDIDGFKAVNDSAGHLAGDELLRTLGRYLNSTMRGGDDVARLGGDEFIVLARGVGQAAAAAANRLIEGWRALEPAATVSLGVAVHHGGETPETTLERADQALYRAKGAGRNQVGISPIDLERFL